MPDPTESRLLQCHVPDEHNPKLRGEDTVALDAESDAALVTQTPPCRCCGTIPCQKQRPQGVPNYGITDDFPLLWEKAQQYDFAERLGGCTDPLLAEIDAAMRECWEARRSYIEDGGRL